MLFGQDSGELAAQDKLIKANPVPGIRAEKL